jgi:hypothetical protein
MPYIITTKTAEAREATAQLNSDEAMTLTLDEAKRREATGTTRRAVATLDEAHDEAAGRVQAVVGAPPQPDEWDVQLARITESGGTVGPLPDGTVIEVVKVCDTWCIGVAEDAGHEFPDPENVTVQEGIDAYNAREANR